MNNYIDGFVFPIASDKLEIYESIAQKVASIWKEHGAINYYELKGDDMNFSGTRTFHESILAKENETVIFGWIEFSSKESRNQIHDKVANDPRMNELIKPIMDPQNLIFDASRMAYGGFTPFVQ